MAPSAHVARSAHVRPAAISTCTLWGAVVISAISHAGNARLHVTLLTAAAVSSMWLLTAFALEFLRSAAYSREAGFTVGVRAALDGLVDVKGRPYLKKLTNQN